MVLCWKNGGLPTPCCSNLAGKTRIAFPFVLFCIKKKKIQKKLRWKSWYTVKAKCECNEIRPGDFNVQKSICSKNSNIRGQTDKTVCSHKDRNMHTQYFVTMLISTQLAINGCTCRNAFSISILVSAPSLIRPVNETNGKEERSNFADCVTCSTAPGTAVITCDCYTQL